MLHENKKNMQNLQFTNSVIHGKKSENQVKLKEIKNLHYLYWKKKKKSWETFFNKTKDWRGEGLELLPNIKVPYSYKENWILHSSQNSSQFSWQNTFPSE